MKREKKKHPRLLYVLRHARSLANERLFEAIAGGEESFSLPMGDKEAPLVPEGEREITNLARWFSQVPEEDRPNCIISSPYRRCEQTGIRLIAEAGLSIPEIILDPRFRERSLGILSGLTELGIQRHYPQEVEKRTKLGSWRYRPPQGESRRDLIKRLRPALQEVFFNCKGENPLIIAHSEIILCLRKMMEGLTEPQAEAINTVQQAPNCSVTSYRRGSPLRLELAYFVAPKI